MAEFKISKPNRTCEHCGNEYTANSRTQKYCGTRECNKNRGVKHSVPTTNSIDINRVLDRKEENKKRLDIMTQQNAN